MGYLALGAMLFSALLPGGREAPSEPYAGFNEITLEQPSEHIAWGIPLEKGPLHALFLAPRFTLRDVAELAQRLELRADTVPLWDARHLGSPESSGSLPGASAQDTLATLSSRLDDDWDTVVAGNFDLALLPEDSLKALIAKVDAGTGLVLVNYRAGAIPPLLQAFVDSLERQEAPALSRGLGEAFTPEWAAGLDFVTAGKHGSGRVVLLDYPNGSPRSHFLLPALAHPMEAETEYAEAYYSLVAKACLWAAGREPEICIDRVESHGIGEPAEEEIPPIFPEAYIKRMLEGGPLPSLLPYRFVLNKPADKNYSVRVQVRQPGRHRTVGYATYETSLPLEKGEQTYALSLPLGAGRHYLDLWLLDKGRVVDWYTHPLEVKGWPSIENISFSKESVLPNGTLGVTFEVPAPIHEDLVKNKGFIVYVRGVDPLQRVVASTVREYIGLSSQVSLDLDYADLIASRLKVEVYVVEAPAGISGVNRIPSEFELNRAAFAFKWFPVRQVISPDTFSFITTGGVSAEYNVRNAYRVLQSLGVDTVEAESGTSDAFYAGEADLHILPCLTSYADAEIDEHLARTPCLSDPAFLRSEASKIEMALRNPWISGVTRFSLGNGNCLTASTKNICQSATCLDGFRQSIEAEYGTIERLGAAWKQYAADWNALVPLNLEEARASGVYPPWVDFRLYMDAVFTSAHTMPRDVLRLQVQKARAGFAAQANAGPYSGYSWDLLAPELDFLGVPPLRLAVDKVRSYRPKDSTALLMCGAGYPPLDAARTRWYPWYAALHGLSGLWYEGALADADRASVDTALTPDARPVPAFHALANEVAILQQGLAPVLLGATRVQAPVAIYDSDASRYLNLAEDSFGANSETAEYNVTAILNALGYTYDFVSADTPDEKLKSYRLLILPMARALSDEEIAKVRQYHSGGGHLLADIAPGAFDEHGVPRDAPAFADLFGVRWNGASKAVAIPNDAAADGAVQAASSEKPEPTAAPSAWLLKKNGEAYAGLINRALPVGSEDAPGLRDRFAEVLQTMGIEPVAPLRLKDKVFHGECTVLRYDKATLFALQRAPDAGDNEEWVQLALPDGYTFDLLHGIPILKGKASFRLGRGEPALVSHLPYDVSELTLAVPQSVVPGRRLPIQVSLKTRGGLPGRHIVRVECGPVPGAPIRQYGRNLVCKEGMASGYIALSQHERPGIYRVYAWDVLTGISAQAMVRVEAPPEPEESK